MENWKNQRLNCIGASEIGALFNCGFDNVIDLWKYKIGEKTKKDINSELSLIGHSSEKVIIDYVKEKFNLDFFHNIENKHFISEKYSFIGCTPDAYNNKAILQCKTYRLTKNRQKWSKSRIPFNYILQTLQEMLVLDKKIGYLAVQYFVWKNKKWTENNIEVFSFSKEIWADTIKEMFIRSHIFWDYVLKKEVPNINYFKGENEKEI
jgi:predicted phage-related endonuclease